MPAHGCAEPGKPAIAWDDPVKADRRSIRVRGVTAIAASDVKVRSSTDNIDVAGA